MMESPSAVEAMERAQIDVQIATARKYPRSISQVKKEMMSLATMDIETAESCFYNLPRGGKEIPGPSIRLAEIALSCFGNVRAATRIVGTSLGDDPHVVIQAVCHDLEKNSAVCIEKRRRITKKKSKDKPDEDDINLATNACSSIALREAIFKIVPGVLIKPVYEAARRVAFGDDKTLAERRDRAVDSFAKMGIQKERICSTLGIRALEEINLEHLEFLTGLRTAIKEGQTTIDQAFPPAAPTKGMFGGEPVPQAPAAPASAPAPKKEAAKPSSARAEGKRVGQEVQERSPDPAPKSELANDKTLLADWMIKNKVEWGQLQPLVSEQIGSWADSIATFDELSVAQAKVIYGQRQGIPAALGI